MALASVHDAPLEAERALTLSRQLATRPTPRGPRIETPIRGRHRDLPGARVGLTRVGGRLFTEDSP
jgi:hypothetical protein